MTNTAVPKGVDSQLLSRILREGYGPGAWHGADIKAAIAGVTDVQAFARLAPGRHNIAEIALHHAYYVHSVRGRLASRKPEPFAMPGDDWFQLDEASGFSWKDVQHVLDVQYERLGALLADLGAGKRRRCSRTRALSRLSSASHVTPRITRGRFS